jgi:hypothetical protein
MLKISREDKPVVAAILFLASAVLIAAAVSFSEAPGSPANQQTARDASGSLSKQPQLESFWQRTVSDPINTFTGLLAMFTVALAGASIYQGWITRKSITLATREFEAAQRPWVSVNCAPATDLRLAKAFTYQGPLEGKQVSLEIEIRLKNVGTTPAVGISYDVRMIEGGTSALTSLQDEMETRLRKYANSKGEFGATLFPQAELIEDRCLSLQSKDPDLTGVANEWKHIGEYIQPYVVGCRRYSSQLGGVGITRFAYVLGKNEPSNLALAGVGGAIRRDDAVIARDKVVMKSSGIGNRAC